MMLWCLLLGVLLFTGVWSAPRLFCLLQLASLNLLLALLSALELPCASATCGGVGTQEGLQLLQVLGPVLQKRSKPLQKRPMPLLLLLQSLNAEPRKLPPALVCLLLLS
jgi:hypothetical protein